MNRRKHSSQRLRFEQLEDRRLLATYVVNDFGDAAATVTECGTPPAPLNLRDAVALANECAGEDTIEFESARATINLANGRMNISDDLIIRGGLMPTQQQGRAGTPEVTIDAQGNSRIFFIDDANGTHIDVHLEALMLTGGDATGNYGGAIYNNENLTLQDMVVDGNTARWGGGISDTVGGGSLHIYDSTIANNYALVSGGGVRSGGEIVITGSNISGNSTAPFSIANSDGAGLSVGGNVLIQDSVISGNTGTRRGGGLHVNYVLNNLATNHVRILDTEISSNSGQLGGGMSVRSRNAPSLIEISNSTFTGNSGGYGGALWNYGIERTGVTDVVMSQVTISSNVAQRGAAIFNIRDGRVTVDSSIIESNTPMGCSGPCENVIESTINSFASGNSDPPELTITNSAIVNNTGGIAVRTLDTVLVVETSTISGNTATQASVSAGFEINNRIAYDGGPYDTTAIIKSTTIANNQSNTSNGAIHAFAATDVTLESSVVSGNTGDMSAVYDITGGAVPVVNYSLLELGAASYTGSGNLIGMSAMLGPLTTNMGYGRATMYHALLPSSPVIDQGSPSIAYGFDQRRYLRVGDGDGMMGATVDMGSFEYGSVPPAPCDLNGDGICNITDLNQVSSDVVNQPFYSYADLNGDDALTVADVLEWLTLAGAQPENAGITGGNPFLQADANLDGTVDGADFIIWNANKFTATDLYGEGDFNANGTVDGQDFIIWNANKFSSSMDRGVVAAQYGVSEPDDEDDREDARNRAFEFDGEWMKLTGLSAMRNI
jgi:hypothetical protein